MRSILTCLTIAAGVFGAQPLTAQTCPGGREPRGDLGITGVRCVGPAASCAINIRSGGSGSTYHMFAVEPTVMEAGAESMPIRVGDTLVAIDGVLITTAAGGRRLADLTAGQPVVLLVRRNGDLIELRITARTGCGITSLAVSR
jgi:S1-C subfamily serine protease